LLPKLLSHHSYRYVSSLDIGSSIINTSNTNYQLPSLTDHVRTPAQSNYLHSPISNQPRGTRSSSAVIRARLSYSTTHVFLFVEHKPFFSISCFILITPLLLPSLHTMAHVVLTCTSGALQHLNSVTAANGRLWDTSLIHVH